MTLCPIAAAVSCTRCPAFKICPATRILGDQKQKKGEKAEPQGPSNTAKNPD